eukprot:XP_011432797.1 PREDICTED: uncharacterized protein LOC105332055 [Crassostrea gigas]
MSTNRDNGFIICIASLSFSFLLQLGKFVSITWKSHKSTLLILWLELLVIILQLICLSLVAVSLKLVYCCLDMSNCVFSFDNQLLCDNEQNLWGRFTLQSWLMFGFSILCTVLQISSIISGYRYFKQSDDGHLGIFKGISELFKNIIHTFSNNRYINEKKMPNYNKTYAFYCILSTTSLALELVFVVSVYAYYFTEGDSSYLIDGLNRFTYYRYYMGSLYKGVIITTLTIIPLAASLRIAAFIWFGFRKSKIPLYTIVVFISIWTLGEVTVLSYVSYLLRLAYGCIDSDSFTFSNVFWRPDRNNVCASFNPKLFVQSGLTVAYLVTHVILDICILITLDGLHPYIVGYEDGRRLSARLFYKTITELRKQTHLQRFYFALLNISLVLNFAFWIGLILMGLIPGYIHTPTGFLNIISRIAISFGSTDMESAVLGVMYSLIAVVPLFGANHVIGIIASLKQNGIMLWVFIISLLLCCIADMVYLAFSSDIVNFRLCFCEKGTHCTEYNLTAIENEHQNACGDLFSNSSSVLLAYIVLTLIVHIIGLCLGIKFLRGIRRTRVGIDEEDNNPLKETHLELSINQEHGGVPNQRIGEHLSTQSHAENQRNASRSAGPTNESIKEMSSSQNIKESEESVAEYGNTVPPNKMTEDNLSSLNITGSNQAENTMQNVETIVQYESSSEVTKNNEAVMDKGDDNNTGQDQPLIMD